MPDCKRDAVENLRNSSNLRNLWFKLLRKVKMKLGTRGSGFTRRIAAAILLCGLAGILSGCGGGGGGSNGGGGGGNSGFATITGQVLLLSTNSAPTTTTTVTSSGVAPVTVAADGTFTLSNVPTSATSLTISVASATVGGAPTVRTLPIALTANETSALGAIYVGAKTANGTPDYTAVVEGYIVTTGATGRQGVGNATVTIAGVQVKTSANAATLGHFIISGLPVGLGSETGVLLGSVQAPGFSSRDLITTDAVGGNLNFVNGLISGVNDIMDVTILQPSGSTPAPPYTITGQVTVSGAGRQSQSVLLFQNGTLIGNTTTDTNGNYFFWVVAGTYTVQATTTSGTAQTKTVSVTLAALDNPVTAPPIPF